MHQLLEERKERIDGGGDEGGENGGNEDGDEGVTTRMMS